MEPNITYIMKRCNGNDTGNRFRDKSFCKARFHNFESNLSTGCEKLNYSVTKSFFISRSVGRSDSKLWNLTDQNEAGFRYFSVTALYK